MSLLTKKGAGKGKIAGLPNRTLLYTGDGRPAGIDMSNFTRDNLELMIRSGDWVILKGAGYGEFGATTNKMFDREGGVADKVGELPSRSKIMLKDDVASVRWAEANLRKGLDVYALIITSNEYIIGAKNTTNPDVMEAEKYNFISTHDQSQFSVMVEFQRICQSDFLYKIVELGFDICNIEPNYLLYATPSIPMSTTVKTFILRSDSDDDLFSGEGITSIIKAKTSAGVHIPTAVATAVGNVITITYASASTAGNIMYLHRPFQ